MKAYTQHTNDANHLLCPVGDGGQSLLAVLRGRRRQQLDVVLDLRLDRRLLLRQGALVPVLEEPQLPLRLDLLHLMFFSAGGSVW